MKYLVIIVMVLSMAVSAYGQVSISNTEVITEKEAIAKPETQKEVIVDVLYIKPTTHQITMHTKVVYYDATNDVVRTKPGAIYNIVDREDDPRTPEDETCTDFTALSKELNALYTAIKTKL